MLGQFVSDLLGASVVSPLLMAALLAVAHEASPLGSIPLWDTVFMRAS